MENRYSNQVSIFNPLFDWQPKIVIIWAGWIWCWTTFALAQLGLNNITVVDFDEVELKNTASQLYKGVDIWFPKVTALFKNVKDFTGIEIKTINEKFESWMVVDADIVIFAVDDMQVRKEIMESLTTKTKRMLDARMSWEFFEIYNYIPVYENNLYLQKRYSNEDASPQDCTSKATSFCTFAIAAIIARFVVGIIKDDPVILNKSEFVVDLHNLIIA